MTCNLCLRDTALRDSHIIPKFMHRPLFDQSGRFFESSTDPKIDSRISQNQLKQKLLCPVCEQKIGKWEKYASEVLFQKSSEPKQIGIAKVFSGIDYKKFKLFQLSLLWRASVSSLPFFINVDLSSGPHEEKIRYMLINENPGKYYEYGCILFFPEDKNLRSIVDVILKPVAFRFESFRGYRFCLNGLFWHFITSSHSDKFPYREGFLQENGDLPLLPDFNRMAKSEYVKFAHASSIRNKNKALNK